MKSKVFKKAWEVFKAKLFKTFSDALKFAWKAIYQIKTFSDIPVGSKVKYASMCTTDNGVIVAPNVVHWEDGTRDEIDSDFEVVKYFSNYSIGFQIKL